MNIENFMVNDWVNDNGSPRQINLSDFKSDKKSFECIKLSDDIMDSNRFEEYEDEELHSVFYQVTDDLYYSEYELFNRDTMDEWTYVCDMKTVDSLQKFLRSIGLKEKANNIKI